MKLLFFLLSAAAVFSEPVPVRVVRTEAVENVSTTSYVGRAEPSKNTVVTVPYPGTVEAVYAVKGRQVRKGQVLATVNSEAVRSAYEIARASLNQAEDGYARLEKVYKTGSVTELKMVEVRTQLEKARAAEKSARQALEDCNVKAPFDGVVGEVFAHKGEQAGALAPLVRLMDIDGVEIHFSVPESEYSHISTGDAAEVEIPALERTTRAFVATKGVSASVLSHSYDFTLKGIGNPGSLMPGMTCKVRIFSGSAARIVLPSTAVMTDMNGRYVWAVDGESCVEKRYVEVGGYAGKGVVISSGLEEGELVIVEGSRKVSTGMKVKAFE